VAQSPRQRRRRGAAAPRSTRDPAARDDSCLSGRGEAVAGAVGGPRSPPRAPGHGGHDMHGTRGLPPTTLRARRRGGSTPLRRDIIECGAPGPEASGRPFDARPSVVLVDPLVSARASCRSPCLPGCPHHASGPAQAAGAPWSHGHRGARTMPRRAASTMYSELAATAEAHRRAHWRLQRRMVWSLPLFLRFLKSWWRAIMSVALHRCAGMGATCDESTSFFLSLRAYAMCLCRIFFRVRSTPTVVLYEYLHIVRKNIYFPPICPCIVIIKSQCNLLFLF